MKPVATNEVELFQFFGKFRNMNSIVLAISVKLDKKIKGSELTLRATLEQVEFQTGVTPDELAIGDLPECAMHLWDWFLELSDTRQNGMSINPISHTEIISWSRLMRIRLEPWEVRALKIIDNAFITVTMEDVK